jgi:uncharacterized protein YbjT (DUF2867 family)
VARVRTLVLGGTGKTGGRIVDRLAARGVPLRVGSRAAEPAFDWQDRATWAPALEDVDAVYLCYQPHPAAPGAVRAVADLAELALARGARRLVLLSGRGESGSVLAERAVRATGAEWTIVRASWLDQNFSEGCLLGPVLAGEVALPARQVGEPFVDARDVADVAVAALTGDGHAGRVYEVTGPRLLTFAEAIEELGAATGRRLRYTRVSLDEYAGLLAGEGVPAGEAALREYLFGDVLDGRNAHLGDGVQRALGREPRDFTDYAWDTAATGVWSLGRVG